MADAFHDASPLSEPSAPKVWQRLFNSREALEDLFSIAGVTINGSAPYDIQVRDSRFYRRVMADGSLGLGESYMDGDWDCAALDQLFDHVISAQLGERLGLTVPLAILRTAAKLQNRQTPEHAREVAYVHYNLPIDIHEATYDKRLTASCAYWNGVDNLDSAQEAKLDLICRKIGLKEHHTVLDVGCGWGSLIGFAAERYGAACDGVTVSADQVAYALKRYAHLPVRPMLLDYRSYRGPRVDRLVSVGMFEHVCYKNSRTYFEVVRRYLEDDGLFLLHTIWENERYPAIDAWQDKYIFPNGDLPSLGEITTAVEGLFVVEDVHNFGACYDKTLLAWAANFRARRPEMVERHGERFCRMWEYYLLQNAGAFRCRHINVGQFVLSPRGVRGGYQSVR
jgi:cyclopropane-fatty-acyl-phospholipid synthase